MGRPMPDFAAYLTLVKSSAAILDQRAMSNRSIRRPTVPNNSAISSNKHKIEDDDDYYDRYDLHVHESVDYEPCHNIDTHVHELESYRAQQSYHNKKSSQKFCTVSMDRETWHNLSSEDKAKWDTLSLSQAGKSSIIQGTRQ